MVFEPPSWVPSLPFDPPDSVPIHEFIGRQEYASGPVVPKKNPFTCGITGRTYSFQEFNKRAEALSRSFAKCLRWSPNEGTSWDKMAAIFAWNTVDYITAIHAIHRLSGIVTPVNAVFSSAELETQLRSSESKILITCFALLDTALTAAKRAGIPEDKIFILDPPGQLDGSSFSRFVTVESLIHEGARLSPMVPLRWPRHHGARQVAFLCYSSGTSGLPKGVMISHHNVIANMLQLAVHEEVGRAQFGVKTQVSLGLLPFSHIYGLVFIAHMALYRGDEIIVLPKFDFKIFLEAVQRFRINQLLLVPPIVVTMAAKERELAKYDLRSVRSVYSAAAPLGRETVEKIQSLFPTWHLTQGYGLTETSPVVSSTGENDVFLGSAGSLLPGTVARIVASDGHEVDQLEEAGELLVQSPAVTLGYFNDAKATTETFVRDDNGDLWLRTGDEVCIRKSPSGFEHLVILDRIKELIKVKGHQVAPAELEAFLLTHSAVDDCAVISVPDNAAGELPKAYIVLARTHQTEGRDIVVQSVNDYVKKHKAHYKWLRGGIEIVESIPKSPSGKILRRILRDKEKRKRGSDIAKL